MEESVSRIVDVSILSTDRQSSQYMVIAHGKVSSSGWTSPRLIPRQRSYQNNQSQDENVLDLVFVASLPPGPHLPIETDIWAQMIESIRPGITSLNIHSSSNLYTVALAA